MGTQRTAISVLVLVAATIIAQAGDGWRRTFTDCLSGPGRYCGPQCLAFDLDDDNDIDLRDWAIMQSLCDENLLHDTGCHWLP